MFIQNKYTNTYFKIINRAKCRTLESYSEQHHIIPKSLGGSNESDNLVKLTAREHFICHLLLIKMVATDVKYKMVYAAWQQSRPRSYTDVKVTGRIYEMLRTALSESYKGRKRAPFSEEWKTNMKAAAQTRKKVEMTEEWLENIRTAVAKRKKLVGEDNPFYGKTHSEDTIKKIIEVNKREYTCPHCGKMGASNSMKRWHFDNCSLMPR